MIEHEHRATVVARLITALFHSYRLTRGGLFSPLRLIPVERRMQSSNGHYSDRCADFQFKTAAIFQFSPALLHLATGNVYRRLFMKFACAQRPIVTAN